MTAMLTDNLPLIAAAPGGIKRLRELILELAVRGKLVPQELSDEPATVLLDKIYEGKSLLVKSGVIRKDKPLPELDESDIPFSLPQGWRWVRLGDITNFGVTNKVDKIPDNFWVLDLEDIEKDTSRVVQRVRFSERRSLSDKNGFEVGDVLYGKLRPYLNKVVVADEPGVCTTEILPVRCYGPMVPLFMRAVLKSPYFLAYVNAKSYGMKMPRLGTDDGRKALFPLAPLSEQNRIVTRVDELMALCDRLESGQADSERAHQQLVTELLATLTQSATPDDFAANWQRLSQHFDTLFTTEASIDALKKAVLDLAVVGRIAPQISSNEDSEFLVKRIAEKWTVSEPGTSKKFIRSPVIDPRDGDVFFLPASWSWVRLGEIIVEGPSNGFSPKPALCETPYRCLTLSATTRGKFNGSSFKYVDIDEETAKKFFLKKGDLLIQRANSIDYVGVSTIYDDQDDLYIFPDLMMRMRVSSELSCRFVHLYLSSSCGRRYFRSHATGTQGNMPKINQGTVVSAPIPIPPIEEQHRIVTKVDELMSLCDSLKSRLAESRATQEKLSAVLVEQAVA